MADNNCFCHFNGYEVKDAAARQSAAENAAAIQAEQQARAAAIQAEQQARAAAIQAEQQARAAHANNKNNPHGVTAAQVGAMERAKIIWENASPTSDFAAQTVTLALSDYDYVLIEFRSTGSSTSRVVEAVFIGKQGILQSPVNVTSTGAYMTWIMRTAKATTTGVQFASGYIKGMTDADSEVSEARCIPTRIFAVKGAEM